MNTITRDMPDLELALLRSSLPRLSEECDRCGACRRSLLVGERFYEYAAGAIRCELCRSRELSDPSDSHTVHGPEFGHTIRVLDRRPRAAA